LHLKLLEIYQERKENSAFETLASELYTTLGDEDPTWQKVAEMGRVLEPANPLYTLEETRTEAANADETEGVATTARQAVDDGIDALKETAADVKDKVVDGASAMADKAEDISDSATAKVAGAAALAGAAVSATGSRIESIVRHEPKQAQEEPEDVSDFPSLELDVESDSTSIEEEDVSEIELSTSSLEDDINDPQLQDFDLSGISLEIDEDTKQAVESADDDLDFDVPEITLGEMGEIPSEEILSSADGERLDDNEVEIKLNLVSAYIDMDDKEGALELLEEVIKEGSDEQVMRAQMMKDSIA